MTAPRPLTTIDLARFAKRGCRACSGVGYVGPVTMRAPEAGGIGRVFVSGTVCVCTAKKLERAGMRIAVDGVPQLVPVLVSNAA